MQQQQLYVPGFANKAQRKKNFVPNFFHRGITAFVLLVLLVISVMAVIVT